MIELTLNAASNYAAYSAADAAWQADVAAHGANSTQAAASWAVRETEEYKAIRELSLPKRLPVFLT